MSIFIVHDFESLNKLPADATGIKFHQMDLTSITADEIAHYMSLVPAHINSLHFVECGLAENPNLVSFARHLPTSVTSLTLAQNNLCQMQSSEVLQEFMKALPAHLKNLDLSHNDLGAQANKSYLLPIFKEIPSSLETLLLMTNFINDISTDEVMEILQAINLKCTHLNVIVNELFEKRTSEDITRIAKVMLTRGNKMKIYAFCNDKQIDALFSGLRETEVEQLEFNPPLAEQRALELNLILNHNKTKSSTLSSLLLRHSAFWDYVPESSIIESTDVDKPTNIPS